MTNLFIGISSQIQKTDFNQSDTTKQFFFFSKSYKIKIRLKLDTYTNLYSSDAKLHRCIKKK